MFGKTKDGDFIYVVRISGRGPSVSRRQKDYYVFFPPPILTLWGGGSRKAPDKLIQKRQLSLSSLSIRNPRLLDTAPDIDL
jgi:hypothetical protein